MVKEMAVQLGSPEFGINEVLEPEKTADYLQSKGYIWLVDLNSGKFLTSLGEGPYIPYRIQFPSGKILDEEEIFQDFSILEKLGFSKNEIKNARIFYESINHEDVDQNEYKFLGNTFISKEDEINTLKKYTQNPFYLEQ